MTAVKHYGSIVAVSIAGRNVIHYNGQEALLTGSEMSIFEAVAQQAKHFTPLLTWEAAIKMVSGETMPHVDAYKRGRTHAYNLKRKIDALGISIIRYNQDFIYWYVPPCGDAELSDYVTSSEAREMLGLTDAQWAQVSSQDWFCPISLGTRLLRGREVATTNIFTKRQVGLIARKIEEPDDLAIDMSPTEDEVGRIMTLNDAAEKLGKSSNSLSMWLRKQDQVRYRHFGNQYVLLARDVENRLLTFPDP